MTEETKVEKKVEAGASSPPSEPVSGETGRSIADVVTKEEFSDLMKQVRGLQGALDKQGNQLKGTQEILDRYEKLREEGKSPEEARATLDKQDKDKEREELLLKIAQKVGVLEPSPEQGPGTAEVKARETTNKVIEELQLDPNDSKVVEILGQGLSEAATEAALLRHKMGLANSTPSISATPAMGSRVASQDDSDALFERLAQLAVNYTDNRQEIEKIESELRGRGLLK